MGHVNDPLRTTAYGDIGRTIGVRVFFYKEYIAHLAGSDPSSDARYGTLLLFESNLRARPIIIMEKPLPPPSLSHALS